MPANNDLYDLLGVPRTATQDEIKKAFKKNALAHHPDKNKENKSEAEAKFKKLTEAYGILSDENKRKRYDATGSIDDADRGGEMNVDINDILASMFGDMGGGIGGSTFMFSGGRGNSFSTFSASSFPRAQSQSPSMVAQSVYIDVNLDDIHKGAKKVIELDIDDMCNHCEATGADNPSDLIKCIMCQGRGNTIRRMGPFVTEMTCPSCSGKGTMIKNKNFCRQCRGKKTVTNKICFDITIAKGTLNGNQQVIKNKGNYNLETKTKNSILVIFRHVVPKNMTVDKGGNVHLNIKITLEDLICGFRYDFNAYGKPLLIYSTKYFNPSKQIVIKDAGIASVQNKSSLPGHLILKFEVIYPEDPHIMQKYNDVFLRVFKKEDERGKMDSDVKKFSESGSGIAYNIATM